MSIYDVCYSCIECNKLHPSGFRVNFLSPDLDGEPVSAAYAGREITSNIKALLERDDLRCPTTGKPIHQLAIDNLFLVAPVQ
jgi:hypothetical protein